MNTKQLKISLNNRIKGLEQTIENIKNDTIKHKTIKDKEKSLNFQIGFVEGLKIAVADLDYKITRKNKHILDY